MSLDFRRIAAFLFLGPMLFCLFSCGKKSAQSSIDNEPARDITAACTLTVNDEPAPEALTDDSYETYVKYGAASVRVSSPEEIGGVYIRFDKTPPAWTLSAGKTQKTCGNEGFLHEYVEVPGRVKEATLSFDGKTAIADIYILSVGACLPDFVQVWQPARGRADIVMFPAHSDDDQLFFAGSAPDAAARGAEMQVCYFTNHWNSHRRPHELLNGLWTCGLRRYPVIGELPDLRSMSIDEGLQLWEEAGYTYDDMVRMQVELIRRFKPQIILAHDTDGEYGHGAHRLDSKSLRDAVIYASDATKYPESAMKYGLWNTPKTYLHLWKENVIDFEIDAPLIFFGGKTAYQVSQDAFRCHISQMSSRYGKWLIGTEEAPVTTADRFNTDGTYGPRSYGLWRSTVGPDVKKTDFYENVTLRRDRNDAPREAPSGAPAFVTILSLAAAIAFALLSLFLAIALRKRRAAERPDRAAKKE